MSALDLVQRLDKVKRSGPAQWTACCPAHEDRSPSLAIRELDDGRVLVHCFGGCSVEDVLAAVGMEFDDLYPPREIGNKPAERRPFSASDVLRCIGKESLIVAATAKTSSVRALSDGERSRAIESAALIQSALKYAGVEVAW